MTDEFFSVVIPTFNRKSFLKKTLNGFFKQSYPLNRFEVVVVDDGSTDGTEKLPELGIHSPAVEYIRQDKHKGPAAARNKGIALAKGTIILLTGDDCVPDAYLIEEHAKAHISYETAAKDIAILGHTSWHPELRITPFMEFIDRGTQFNYHVLKDGFEAPFGYFYTSNISLQRQKLIDVGLFDENFEYAAYEDIELGYRLWKTGLKIIYVKNAVTYHIHPTNLQKYIQRQIRVGRSAVTFCKKHPELRGFLGIDDIANPEFRDHFYGSVLRYYALVGIDEALRSEAVARHPEVTRLKDELSEQRTKWTLFLLEKAKQLDEPYTLVESVHQESRVKGLSVSLIPISFLCIFSISSGSPARRLPELNTQYIDGRPGF